MAYRITIKKNAIKVLEKINAPYYTNIKKAIYALADNPRPFGYKKLKGREGYRIRISEYRVIYNIFDNELVVDVIDIGLRKDIYE